MNVSQRQESPGRTISGKKIINCFTCTVKEVRSLSPHQNPNLYRQQTYQTDSFKQILTKRSQFPSTLLHKQHTTIINKLIKRIKVQPPKKKEKENNKSNKSNNKKKCSTISLKKYFKQDQSNDNKNSKSMSPSRIGIHQYRSGPNEKRNYLSNNVSSKTSREVFHTKSMKNLTERNRYNVRKVVGSTKQQKKQNKVVKAKNKIQQNNIVHYKHNKKESSNYSHTEQIAKEFDNMLKIKNNKKKCCDIPSKKKIKAKSKSKDKKSNPVNHCDRNQKNQKNYHLLRQKINSCQSVQSRQSSKKGQISNRYPKNKGNIKRRSRLSFEPSRKKGKNSQKAKTEALSPQKKLQNKNEAAKTIQKFFRGYMTRKYYKQFKKMCSAATLIQQVWRRYQSRKQLKVFQSEQQQSRNKKKQLNIQNIKDIIQPQRNSLQSKHDELASLLQEILKQQNVNQIIKVKINDFLKKDNKSSKNSGRSSSVESHLQQQIRSQKRYFQQIEKKKYGFGSPVTLSQHLYLTQLQKSPQLMIQNLLTIKQFQKQKLIRNAKLQLEGLQNLAIKKLFSPRTKNARKQQIHKKLEEDLQKFDQSITEVIKTCKDNDQLLVVKPFTSQMTPQKQKSSKKQLFLLHSPKLAQQKQSDNKISSSSQQLQDLSMQLLQYYQQNTQQKKQKQYQKLDSSYQLIQEYLLNLFQYIRQQGHDYRQNFIQLSKTNRNLTSLSILKNLYLLSEQSDEQDNTFKLPYYKYLQQQKIQIISPRTVNQFNNSYRNQLELNNIAENIYLKMIIDAFNQALNLQRPYQYIFTQSLSMWRANKIKKQKQLQADPSYLEDNQSQFSLYFANSMNHIYKWAHFQCGREQDIDQQTIKTLNQNSLRQFLKCQARKQQNYYDELLQVIVALSGYLFEEIVMEFMEDAAYLYL